MTNRHVERDIGGIVGLHKGSGGRKGTSRLTATLNATSVSLVAPAPPTFFPDGSEGPRETCDCDPFTTNHLLPMDESRNIAFERSDVINTESTCQHGSAHVSIRVHRC